MILLFSNPGVDGGFLDKSKNFDYEYDYKIVILPDPHVIQLPCKDLPPQVQYSVDAIIAIDSASKKNAVDSFILTEELKESKYAKELLQLNNNVKISRGNLKCEHCDLKENLWLNLTDGSVLCGREVYGGGGGNGHALAHYKKTGYPLVVKLGTITPDGNADVYSYAEDENDMVLDPYLEKHLAHFGIDMSELRKTEKSLAELDVEYQYVFELNRIMDKNKELKPLYGPGYTGIENIGNTCYMASILQVLNSIPEFISRYYEQKNHIFESSKKDPPSDFLVQLSKISDGLMSGDYSIPIESNPDQSFIPFTGNGIKPNMFKAIVGKGHPEFSSSRQQDSLEFFQYLLTLIERSEHAFGDSVDPGKVFALKFEDRIQCSESSKVKYSERSDNVVSLPIPFHEALNIEEYKKYLEEESKKTDDEKKADKENNKPVVRPKVSLIDCFDWLCQDELLDNYYSSAIRAKTTAIKTTRFATMPKYMMIQVRKFDLTSGWIAKKIEVDIEAPDFMDLEKYRGHGLQSNEEEMPVDKSDEIQQVETPWDDSVVSMLVEMDIPLIRAQRASMATKGDANAAMEWLFSNLDDPSLDEPIELNTKEKSNSGPDEASIAMVMETGFTREKAIYALKKTDSNVERAVDWLFSHDEDMVLEEEGDMPIEASSKVIDDGKGEYELMAFVTHIGSSTMSGHYVCHIKKNGKWVYYNDESVAESTEVPKEMAYLYIYKRK